MGLALDGGGGWGAVLKLFNPWSTTLGLQKKQHPEFPMALILSKGVIMLGNMPSQYTGKFVPVFLCRWMSMVNASVG
jgi:hypothetical protein